MHRKNAAAMPLNEVVHIRLRLSNIVPILRQEPDKERSSL